MKLIGITKIAGTITLKSGLHIGAGDVEMRIGGTDSPVIKNPFTNEPYIPGSSIKGKVRSLLEMRSGLIGKTGGKPLDSKTVSQAQGNDAIIGKNILRLFGTSGADGDLATEIGPTRASFADCAVNGDCRDELSVENLPFTEVKSENSINRIKGVADNPRFIERVSAGVVFDFSFTIKEMEGDDDLLGLLLEGLKLLELDALGGSGSRGYGRVQFNFTNPEIQEKFNTTVAI